MDPSVRPVVEPYLHDEEILSLTRKDGLPRLLVRRPERAEVVLGRGSRVELELDARHAAADGVAVTRRRGGGCAVVLDPGCVLVSVALPAEGLGGNLGHFERISAWLAAGLERLGVRGVYRAGSSDLMLGDRKIGGACLYRTRGVLLYSLSLLVEPPVELMERYLPHPPREPQHRRRRAHRDFVGSVLGAVWQVGCTDDFAQRLRKSLRLGDLLRMESRISAWAPAEPPSGDLAPLSSARPRPLRARIAPAGRRASAALAMPGARGVAALRVEDGDAVPSALRFPG